MFMITARTEKNPKANSPRYRIVHTPNLGVNDCANDFLLASASQASTLKDKGFREVGRTYGLKFSDLPAANWVGGWSPSLRICPIGGTMARDMGLEEDAYQVLNDFCKAQGISREALNLRGQAKSLGDAKPIHAKLFLVKGTFAYANAETREMAELFLLNPKDGELMYSVSPERALYLFGRGRRKRELVNPKGSHLPWTLKVFSSRVDSIKEVGEMDVESMFLQDYSQISPRIGSGSTTIKPHLGTYRDFEIVMGERAEKEREWQEKLARDREKARELNAAANSISE